MAASNWRRLYPYEFEETQTADATFGVEMLEDFRNRLKCRRAEDTKFYDCTNEHLEGFAYVLTSESCDLARRSTRGEIE